MSRKNGDMLTNQLPDAGTLQRWVLDQIAAYPDTTALEIAERKLVSDPTYGKHKDVSSHVALLRKKGFVTDVAERCSCCGAAKTRGQKHVRLDLTPQARLLYVGAAA